MPSTLPDALQRLRRCGQQNLELRAALAWGTLPAWVIADVLEENERLRFEVASLRAHLPISSRALRDLTD